MCYLELCTSKGVIAAMLQFKDGISIDLKESENIKVVKEDFEQALLDVKPVSMGSCDLIMMSLSPSGIWCEQ